jgi:hypothetical protein
LVNLDNGVISGCRILGKDMQQHPNAIPAIDLLVKYTNPARFLEIGTANGGLSIFLSLVCKTYTFDVTDFRSYMNLHNVLDIDFRLGDVFQHIEEIGAIIQEEGCSIVMCDGGNKPRELRTFAPYLKKCDIIMAHDYTIDPQNIWPFSEITKEDVEDIDYLEPYLQEVFDQAAWLCRRRVR